MEQETTFIRNHGSQNVLSDLLMSLEECEKFYFTVAFMTFGGVQLLVQKLNELKERGVHGKILTSTYQQFSEPKAIEKLQSFKNIEVRLYDEPIEGGLHAKGYLFMRGNWVEVYIGSSNLTPSALRQKIEWNVKLIKSVDDAMVKEILADYQTLWERAGILTEEKLEKYRQSYQKYQLFKKENVMEIDHVAKSEIPQPNSMQQLAMERLRRLREKGESKALVIAATGAGKTYMSAFDVAQVNPNRMLFLVHREDILYRAKETFEYVLGKTGKKMGIYTSNVKEVEADYLFSTVQTMSRHFKNYARDSFDYLIVDEAHHIGGETYQQLLNYFTPKFLLGMTATPERCDDFNIFDCFDGHVALEVRLRDALEQRLIVPFHYFGIRDIDGVDLSNIKADQIHELTKRLKVNERVSFILEQMDLYGHDGRYRKGIGFCASIEHAEYMTKKFNEASVPSVCLTGNHSPKERQVMMNRLACDEDPLEMIFTVDIFNEGIDIPSINTVLMLRPTQSPIIFIQQLGRGLRKNEDKEFLTVLDFIGNHKKSFLMAIALSGDRFYDKDSLKVAVATNFAGHLGDSFVTLDAISKEQILSQLENEKFNSMMYLKEAYAEFKRMKRGQIPYMLCDYLGCEGAPDPLAFVKKSKTYLQFIYQVEKDLFLESVLSHDTFVKVLKEWSSQLPLKRPYEFILMKYLLNHREVMTLNQELATREILKYVDSVSPTSVTHALECLGQTYYDLSDQAQYVQTFDWIGGTLVTLPVFNQLRSVPHFKTYLDDVLTYGLVRYQEEFSTADYGDPFLKLYETYSMREVAKVANYNKKHSAFRGSGLLTYKNNFFLFVELHKEKDIKESINYDDCLTSSRTFQWQSPNKTTQESPQGQNLIKNVERQIHLHLFVRKFKKLDGDVQPYIYLGKANTLSASGNNPITLQLELEHEIPPQLYRELSY